MADLLATDDVGLGVFNVDFKGCPEISDDANVSEPALVIFKDGQEITRYSGGHLDQIEYVLSRILCGLMGPNGELSTEG